MEVVFLFVVTGCFSSILFKFIVPARSCFGKPETGFQMKQVLLERPVIRQGGMYPAYGVFCPFRIRIRAIFVTFRMIHVVLRGREDKIFRVYGSI